MLGTYYVVMIIVKVKDKGALRHEDNKFTVTNKTRKARDREKDTPKIKPLVTLPIHYGKTSQDLRVKF